MASWVSKTVMPKTTYEIVTVEELSDINIITILNLPRAFIPLADEPPKMIRVYRE